MRTSADLGSLRSQKRRWKQACRAALIIVSLVVFCSIVAGAIGCGEKSSEEAKLPEIVSFQANLPANEGDPVNYTFEVKNASKIVLIEAGETIKEIAGPSSGIYEGTATGQVLSTALTSDNKTLDAVLEASNDFGKVDKKITQSDSQSQTASLRTVGGYGTCPTGCNCMTPAAAAALNLTYQCSPGHVCGLHFQWSSPHFTWKYCYSYQPCPANCNCLYDLNVQTCASPLSQCSPNICGPTGTPPGNTSSQLSQQHCYRCPTGNCYAIGQEPAGYIKTSDCPCGRDPVTGQPTKYCYREACPGASGNSFGCQCRLDTEVAQCDWTTCSAPAPCNNYGDPPDKHCYMCSGPSWWCLTPAEAADPIGWYDYTEPSACKCSVSPDKWCYHKKPFYADCDNTTGCTCWPDEYINNNCQGQNMTQCPTALPCGVMEHCYHCPPDCMCLYDNDPQISSDNLVQCTSGNCKCIEGKDAHCYKRPGT